MLINLGISLVYCVNLVRAGCNIGPSDVYNYNQNFDYNAGYQYVIPASPITCCGILDSILYYPVQTGDIYFHIWRPTSVGVYELTGRYYYYNGYANTSVTITVDVDISVRTNDIIGWYTPGDDQLPHQSGSTMNQENLLLGGLGLLAEGYSLSIATPYTTDRTYAVRYRIYDSNDPSFTSWTGSVSIYDSTTSGTAILQLSATDPDDQDISTLTFILTNTNPNTAPFDVSSSGEVSTTAMPIPGTYILSVRVRDACSKHQTRQLYVYVLNWAPRFSNLPASVDVHESTDVETLLYSLSVLDNSGNDTISCYMSSSNPASAPFIVKYKSGTSDFGIYLTDNPGLSHTTTALYDLNITCSDSKDATTEVFTVYVLDSRPPVLWNLPNTVTISSKTTPGSIVFSVNATDPEADTLVYYVRCGTCPFSISAGGHILLTSSIVSSLVYSYSVEVIISDGSSTKTSNLAVLVNDVNNKPEFSNLDTSIIVKETETLGSTIFIVTAVDLDNDALTYHISYDPSITANKFGFDEATGRVTVIETLDYESNLTHFNITFEATDGKNPANPGVLSITILDMNEAPVFDRNIYYTTKDECCNGHEFPDPGLSVTDPEGDSFTYDFAPGGDDHQLFSISSTTGRIRYRGNYDIDRPNFMPDRLTFMLKAVDSRGASSTVTLSVSITDRSDYDPVFANTLYTTTVSNNVRTPSSVMYVTATDDDYGPTCNDITYTIITTTQYFTISKTGLVQTKRTLSSFLNETTLNFTVEARDGCNRYQTVRVEITVQPGLSNDYFDNPSNVAWFVLAVVGGGLVAIVLFVVIYRMCKFGYIFRKESFFNVKTSISRNAKTQYTSEFSFTYAMDLGRLENEHAFRLSD